MIAPMKNSLMSSFCAVSSIEPTRISDMPATARPAIASAVTDFLVLHEALTDAMSAGSGLKSRRWVLSEKISPAPYAPSITTATMTESVSTLEP
ncbi:unannotated protein [freshwater metagenome]|uniref:Unannotated protein n=1 Tax=freshwater metagenome TaxID=449393 RepID=A0A6J5ZYW7_9ZZZZ